MDPNTNIPSPDNVPPVSPDPVVPPVVPQQPLPQAPMSADQPAPIAAPQPEPVVTPPAPGFIIGGENAPGVPIAQPMFGSGAVVVGGKPKRGKLLMVCGIVLLLVLASTGIVFGYYLPNQPKNVWNSGLDRSGKALETLVSKATEQQTLDSFKKSEANLTIEAGAGDASYNGTLNIKYDGTKSNGNLAVTAKQKGDPDKVINAKFLSELKKDKQYPDIYLQVSGLKQLSSYGESFSGFSALDGKWIAITEDYLRSLGVDPTSQDEAAKEQISSDDIAQAAQALSSTSVDYLFTSNTQKAVFEQRKYVGKEKVEGINTYHYIAGVNKAHAKDYCQAIVSKMSETSLYKKILKDKDDQQATKAKDEAIRSCKQGVDEIPDDYTLHVWVDLKHKLVYKIRMYDDKDKSAYAEVGQKYNGGDDISLFMNVHAPSSKTDMKSTIDTNLKTHVTKGTLSMDSTSEEFPYNLKISLDAKPYTGDIDVTVPKDAVPIQQVLQQLGFDMDSIGGAQGNSKDIERMTDINAIRSHLEAYYADNNSYPTLAQLNDAKFRKASMPGLDEIALNDPAGTSFTLSATSNAGIYSYKTQPANCKNAAASSCDKFTLSATLEDHSLYTKESLN